MSDVCAISESPAPRVGESLHALLGLNRHGHPQAEPTPSVRMGLCEIESSRKCTVSGQTEDISNADEFGDGALVGAGLSEKSCKVPIPPKTVQRWKIALRVGHQPLFESPNAEVSGFRWIEPPKDHFWADPFVVEHQGKHWMFFEDYFYPKRRAGIACAEIFADGTVSSPQSCLESEHHYSYPHVFRCGKELLMVPESLGSNSVDLYRCIEFPAKWERERTLLEGRFVDTTIWQRDGLWGLMTSARSRIPAPDRSSFSIRNR